jgi:hypothetical protein
VSRSFDKYVCLKVSYSTAKSLEYIVVVPWSEWASVVFEWRGFAVIGRQIVVGLKGPYLPALRFLGIVTHACVYFKCVRLPFV